MASDIAAMLDGLLRLMVVAGLVYISAFVVEGVRGRVVPAPARPRRGRVWPGSPTLVRHSQLWAVGLIGAFALPAAAQRRVPDAPSLDARAAAAPPWSATSGFPPPRPLVRTGALSYDVVKDGPATRHERVLPPGPRKDAARESHDSSVPASSYVAPHAPGPTYVAPDSERERDAVERARASHPAGKARPGRPCPSLGRHVVVTGDTLWDIAAGVLRTDDVARIARYWPTIHRANRSVIGPDPSLIIPGMILELPVECRDRHA